VTCREAPGVTSQRGKDTTQQVEGLGAPCLMVNKVGALALNPSLLLLELPLLLLLLSSLLLLLPRLLLAEVEEEPAWSRKRKRPMRSNGSTDTEGSCSLSSIGCGTECLLRVARCTWDRSTDLTPPLTVVPLLLLLPLLLWLLFVAVPSLLPRPLASTVKGK